jgi:hypothetical protein
MKSIAPRNRDVRDTYIKRFIIDYRLYIGLRNICEQANIYLNNTASDAIRYKRIIYIEEY